ncbi:tyrosine-type recombinase/integrase [Streptomyces spectabilis]|uniref:Site-specific integrase n=1 Tax=Streptomyces spectabilis TaxID=68270 RepID=A0A516RBV0_STRST|nr:site-specific integrase [Streptomyces spectabilis]QDQ13130.1 site-specific integrase [Streptomyces spectabilis]
MADVYDRWHKSRPGKDDKPCKEHSSKTRKLVPSGDHGTGKRWQVRWRDASGKQRKENFDKRAAADTRAATVKADLDRGLYVDPAAGKESFRAVAERWRTSAVHRSTTVSRVERGLRNHVYPTFGDRPVASIRASDVQAWIKDRAQVLAPSTLEVTYAYLITPLRTAVRDRIIASNPCDGIRLPRQRKAEVVPLHERAVRALIDAAAPRFRALYLLAASSGLRQGELFGLEVDCVDFLRREVKVRQQLIDPDDGVPYLGEPKTHESYRTVPLTKAAVDALAAHLERFPAPEVKIEDRTDPRKPRERTARLMFVNQYREVVRRGAWSQVWGRSHRDANKALAEAYDTAHAAWVRTGKPEGGEPARAEVPKGASLHDLRHFYASLLIKHRENVKTVQKRLGHSKPSITLDTYTHLWPDDEDTTRAAVEAVLGDVPPLCPVKSA